ncbi:vascular endothelial growth factor A isoform X2 [Latimeria chalumnae]|uniref:vascular endothelial growth factor A isoform X2 n=1 Tax=Latimeria chalumnae TaxID=7897 RepID=UPI00313E0CF5
MKWLDVYNRSFCQPKEMLVSINTEYPEEVEHIFVPSCVPLQRCAGCCTDEQLECVPTKTHIIIMEIMKTRYLSSEFVHLPFVQHSLCECKPKKDKGRFERPPCSPCTEKRRQQNPQTCECTCRTTPQRCQARGMELNEHSCRWVYSPPLHTLTPPPLFFFFLNL